MVSHYVAGDAGPRYWLTSVWPERRGSLAELPLSQLLATHHGVVDFVGREAELAELRRWRDEGAGGPAALLIHGPGGQGKTRLAVQFAAECRGSGWNTAAARYSGTETSLQEFQASGGLLVIVDYAERWPVEDLLRLAADRAIRAGGPLRLLLVARSSGWWGDVRHEFADQGFDVGQLRLGPLAGGVADRGALFDRARDRFGEILGVSDTHRIARPAGLAKDSFGLVLAVHMAALAAVDAHARGESAPEDPAELSAYLLDRERAYWRRLHRTERLRIRSATMARSVFTATLTGPLPYPDAVAMLEKAGVPSAAEPSGAVLEDHAICYPSADAGTVLGPLYPDRLAEDFLALLIPGHDAPGYTSDAWAAAVPARLLTDDPAPGVVQSALTVLVEAAHRWPHLVHGQVGPLLRAHPQLALSAGGAVLATVAELDGLDHDVLEAIEPLLPPGRHVDLDIGVAAVAERLTDRRLAADTNPAIRATRHAILSDRLRTAGRRVEALAAIEEAVRIRRVLAELLPPVFRPVLARSLHSLGACLAELLRWDEALAAADEARRSYQALAHPVYRPELAAALDSFSNCLSELGRHEEALSPIEESVRIRRDLVRAHPQAYRSDLARGLLNLAVQLRMVNRPDEALRASEEAVRIDRELADAQPQVYQPELALALNNLGIHLYTLGRYDRALAVAREAVGAYRVLAETNPRAFEFELSRSLLNLGNWLAHHGRNEQALAATEEAVRIRRRLADANPRAFGPELGKSLDSLAADLSDLDRFDEAAAVAAEEVQIYRGSTTDGVRPDLGDALERLSRALSQAGRADQALAAAQEAVTTYRREAGADPATFLPRLASSLNSLGARLSQSGRPAEAVTVTQEAVEIFRGLAEDLLLAMALGNLATYLSLIDRPEEALAAAYEAVRICREGAEDHRPELASLLSRLGVSLYPFGRFEEARAAAEEATRIYRSLAGEDPAFQRGLAEALHSLGVWLIGLNRWSEAAESLGEAVQIRRRLADSALAESQLLLAFVSERMASP